MAKLNFGGVEENVITRDEFPLEKARDILKDEVIAIIGYGGMGKLIHKEAERVGMEVISTVDPNADAAFEKLLRD